MDPPFSPNAALSRLQSDAQVELLDMVDDLRGHGFEKEFDLPQLIVCGAQSAGKSSVLEAISRHRFPAAERFCTRFATELVLRRSESTSFTASIVAAQHRTSPDERSKVMDFKCESSDVPVVIEEATRHLESFSTGRAFYEDRLRIEICGPHQPQLTLVDLPGLIHVSNSEQSESDIGTVRRLLTSYMAKSQSIILAVLAAFNDIATQEVLELARQVDSDGDRTMGIITKPDRVDNGSEHFVVKTAMNQDNKKLNLGWHVLRNRGFLERDLSADARDNLEETFFQGEAWRELPAEYKGASQLCRRLSRVLLTCIQKNLPVMTEWIHRKIEDESEVLKRLGKPRPTKFEQQLYLHQICSQINDLVKAGLRGNYEDDFFKKYDTRIGESRRFRSWLRRANDRFAKDMWERGHRHEILERLPRNMAFTNVKVDLFGPVGKAPAIVPRSHYVCKVHEYLQANRACELPGNYAPSQIGDIFRLQAASWKSISEDHLKGCVSRAHEFVRQVLSAVAPPHTAQALYSQVVQPTLEEADSILDDRLEELLKPYLKSHPMTLNRSFVRDLDEDQKARIELRSRDEDAALAVDVSGRGNLEASHIVDQMQTYYKIAIGVFVDNVATLAIESCLVGCLSGLLHPELVVGLTDDQLRVLASEPDDVADKRVKVEKDLRTLQRTLRTCRMHAYNYEESSGRPSSHERVESPDLEVSSPRDSLAESLASMHVSPAPTRKPAMVEKPSEDLREVPPGMRTPSKDPFLSTSWNQRNRSPSDLSRPTTPTPDALEMDSGYASTSPRSLKGRMEMYK